MYLLINRISFSFFLILQIKKVESKDVPWENLETMNISSNQLKALPERIVRMTKLQRLYASDNQLTFDGNFFVGQKNTAVFFHVFDKKAKNAWKTRVKSIIVLGEKNLTSSLSGIPSGIGKLIQLQVLYLSHNQLELIPEGVSRCVRLRRLKLDNNRLITLPDSIHLLPDLKQLDLHKLVFLLFIHVAIFYFYLYCV